MSNQAWNIDPSHSGIHFTVRHMVISKVRGAFTRWQGKLEYDEADPTSAKVTVRIEADSIDTHEPKRDAHLRSADFFDARRRQGRDRARRAGSEADGRPGGLRREPC